MYSKWARSECVCSSACIHQACQDSGADWGSGGQVSLLPHGRAIHYSQSWEKSGRKIRKHRPTELGSIDCTFLFRSTRWLLPAWPAHWRWPCTKSDECSDSTARLRPLESVDFFRLLMGKENAVCRVIWFFKGRCRVLGNVLMDISIQVVNSAYWIWPHFWYDEGSTLKCYFLRSPESC